MDNREILIRFKDGTIDSRRAIALLRNNLPERPEPTRLRPPHPTAASAPPVAIEEEPPSGPDGWAVIGMAGRYPQACDLDAFWLRVLQPRDTRPDPPKRRGAAGDSVPGHFIEHVDEFDPEFFGLTGEQAAMMDPQERLFLEVAWEALEGAGYTGARLDALIAADGEPRSVGVYAAISSADYAALVLKDQADDSGAPLANGHWRLPNRLSALLDLRGPSHSVDTAESSFLTAVHQALDALRSGECAAALVGAVDLRLHPSRQAPDSGEGVGAVLLKPLAAARADGDTVHAVIRSSAVVHQGRHDLSAVEERLVRRSRAATGIATADITLRETAHSVARCVGDAGAATGIAALTRTVLQLRNAALAPDVPDAQALPWAPDTTADGTPLPRRASVTVRGSGGLCAQLVVEENADRGRPGAARTTDGQEEELVLLSAPTPQHLAVTARRFAVWAAARHDAAQPGPELADMARELRTGRGAMACRLAVTARDTTRLAAALRAFAADPGADSGAVRSIDLRTGQTVSPLIGELPETRDYLTALWQGRRYEQLTRLWLCGVDVTAVAPPRTPVLPVPTSPLIRRPLWYGRGPERDR
ncbi:polyketide synthase [Streptomyces canus]|uniref:beta-ketoacyl [acyl carrier protein] synthase domain-containing protein n=1 Tax=Streptomyces canus TaxID=58343 RepID=UPI0036A08C71